MIALCIGLASLSALLTGFVITCGIWLHSANADRLNAADLLDGQRKLVAEYKSKFDTEFVAHTVTSARLADEQHLRAVAEAQRNEAMRRTNELLRKHLEVATDDEIRAITAEVFSSPLRVVPPSVPRLSDDPTNGLIDPFKSV